MPSTKANNAVLEIAVTALNGSPPNEGRLKGKAMMDLHKTVKPLADALAPYAAAKQAIFEDFGTLKGDGQFHVDRETKDDEGNAVPNPRWSEFKQEYEEILNEEVELDALPLPVHLLDTLEFDRKGWLALIELGVVKEEQEEDEAA